MSYADAAGRTAKPLVQSGLLTKNLNLANNFSRLYRLPKLPPNGLSVFISKKFESCDQFQLSDLEYNGKSMWLLTLHFENKEDFENSEKFSITIGTETINFQAINAKNTDGSQAAKPAQILQNVHLSNMPYHMAINESYMNNLLTNYVDFEFKNIIKLKRGKMFCGDVLVPVSKFKKLPPRKWKIDYVDKNGSPVPDTKINITVVPTGFNPETEREKVEKIPCKICKGSEGDHPWFRCPKRKIVRKPCHTCGQFLTCKNGICSNIDKIQEGEFPLPKKANVIFPNKMPNLNSFSEMNTPLTRGNPFYKETSSFKRPRHDSIAKPAKTLLNNKFAQLSQKNA